MKKLFAAALTAMIAVSGVLAKPNPDFTKNINKFGHVGVWNTHSAQTLGYGRLALNAYWNTALDKDFIKNIYLFDEDGFLRFDSLIDPNAGGYRRETIIAGVSYGLTRYLDLAVMVPFYVDNIGERRVTRNIPNWGFPVGEGDGEYTKYSLGDLDISLKFQYPPYPHRDFFKMAYYGAVSVPTGADGYGFFPRQNSYIDKKHLYGMNNGMYSFYTSNNPEVDMKMLWTWDFREMSDFFPVLFHINYGLRWATQYRNNHVFNFNSAIEIRPTEWLNIFTEFSATPRFTSIQQDPKTVYRVIDGEVVADHSWKSSMLDDPMRISPGLSFLTPVGITVAGGVDISLANKNDFYYGDIATSTKDDNRPWQHNVMFETGVEPKIALAVSLGWNGLTVKRHAPISVPIPEPEPVRDTIRIIDTVFVDRFITDTLKVEVAAKPAPVRTFTITASVAAGQGTITPFGVNTVNEGAVVSYAFTPAAGFSIEQVTVNGINQGPLAQHTFINVRENQIITVSFREDPRPVVIEVAPTPVAVEIPREGLILRGVNFQTGSARLTPSSYDALDAVIRSLRDWPEVRLEIQGHTDATGARNTNMRLSRDRANSVMNYFIQQGVPAERLRAVGYGPDVPIADNDTPSGRELNRRVELKRFD